MNEKENSIEYTFENPFLAALSPPRSKGLMFPNEKIRNFIDKEFNLPFFA